MSRAGASVKIYKSSFGVYCIMRVLLKDDPPCSGTGTGQFMGRQHTNS